MEKLDKVHPVLEGIIMDAALEAVDRLFTKVTCKTLYRVVYRGGGIP